MALTNEQQYNYDVAKERIGDAIRAMKHVKSCRETSLALTKLEEGSMWLSRSHELQQAETLESESN